MPKSLRVGLRKLAGFTMVELMIVIAIIGVIAVAVLSAINPIEQINKGRDTRVRSDASELLNGIERFYAINEMYPTETAGSQWSTQTAVVSAHNIAVQLVGASELKQGFETRVTGGIGSSVSNLSVYMGTTRDQIYVCFTPASHQFTVDASKKCVQNSNNYGTLYGTLCPAGSETYCMP